MQLSLASAYRAAGRTGEAIPLYEAVLAKINAEVGPDHPETKAVRALLTQACTELT
ncbi:tetratricopeptide repeat protein [Actinocrinis puniceicyclus]|uniref:Tetratricopeptide repeat protein n=1 Tax=Actinocrinis puniceicyclus TaxID=977794 RepID=A0A8J7WRY8_9ACTN|nr:tetratricopeptide repeat protein [Actinocrinis puniceicyclus]